MIDTPVQCVVGTCINGVISDNDSKAGNKANKTPIKIWESLDNNGNGHDFENSTLVGYCSNFSHTAITTIFKDNSVL